MTQPLSPPGSTVRRTVLPGGLRVVTEAMPTVRSVAVGIWAAVGSRDEPTGLGGASHYLEHLLFKGTRRRDALEISAVMDAVGGELNAFTAKEYTCYYARVLDSDLPLAVDVVTDMVTSSLLADVDVDAERGVILEEIAMHEDDPADVVHDDFAEAVFGVEHPLGRPVLGTVDTITQVARDSINGYYRDSYVRPRLVVAAAGNLDHDDVVRQVAAAMDAGALAESDLEPVVRRDRTPLPPADHVVRMTVRPSEQANLVLGGRGLARTDERRFALGVLNAALGGGMSSRLFQEVREKRGLAYSVYSFTEQHADTGLFGVYAGCQPSKVDQVLRLCREQLADVAAHGLRDEEVARGKGQLAGSLVLGLEDTGSRMTRVGKSELVYGELLSVDEILGRIAAVTPDDVREVAAAVLGGPLSLGITGPFEGARDFAAAVA